MITKQHIMAMIKEHLADQLPHLAKGVELDQLTPLYLRVRVPSAAGPTYFTVQVKAER